MVRWLVKRFGRPGVGDGGPHNIGQGGGVRLMPLGPGNAGLNIQRAVRPVRCHDWRRRTQRSASPGRHRATSTAGSLNRAPTARSMPAPVPGVAPKAWHPPGGTTSTATCVAVKAAHKAWSHQPGGTTSTAMRVAIKAASKATGHVPRAPWSEAAPKAVARPYYIPLDNRRLWCLNDARIERVRVRRRNLPNIPPPWPCIPPMPAAQWSPAA